MKNDNFAFLMIAANDPWAICRMLLNFRVFTSEILIASLQNMKQRHKTLYGRRPVIKYVSVQSRRPHLLLPSSLAKINERGFDDYQEICSCHSIKVLTVSKATHIDSSNFRGLWPHQKSFPTVFCPENYSCLVPALEMARIQANREIWVSFCKEKKYFLKDISNQQITTTYKIFIVWYSH